MSEADGIKRAHEWGARAIACLEAEGLLRRMGDLKQVYPVDEAGVVDGVFIPLAEPQTARLVVALLDGYLARAAQAGGGAAPAHRH